MSIKNFSKKAVLAALPLALAICSQGVLADAGWYCPKEVICLEDHCDVIGGSSGAVFAPEYSQIKLPLKGFNKFNLTKATGVDDRNARYYIPTKAYCYYLINPGSVDEGYITFKSTFFAEIKKTDGHQWTADGHGGNFHCGDNTKAIEPVKCAFIDTSKN